MNDQDSIIDSGNQMYQDILPLRADSLDLLVLDPRGEAFAADWMAQLFRQGQLQINAEAGYPVSETIQHLYFSSRNHERVKGLPTLGLGYPLLLWKNGEQTIAAPLFIWQLELALAPGSATTWVFSHGKEERLDYNRELATLLARECDEAAEEELSKAIKNNSLSAKNLVTCCQELATLLGVENNSQSITITECPSAEDLPALVDKGMIQWSAIVGLFSPQIPATALPENINFKEEIVNKGHDFGLLPLDPFQASGLETIFSQKTTVIEGSAGTGKTHLLAHLLTNALSNGKRCLVVSENLGALRQIQNRLGQLGLTQYNFLLQDGLNDKPVMTDLLCAIANSDAVLPTFDEVNYRASLDKSTRLKNKLDENYRSVRCSVFGPYNWTQTVGRFLRSNRSEGKELLASQLNAQDFLFNYSEYLNLQNDISNAFPLYAKVNTLRHPLSNLHPTIFTKKDKADSLAFVEQQLNAFLDKANSLHLRFISKINAYTDLLTEHYEGYYGELATRVIRLKDQMADYSSRYGADFDHAGAGALKLRGVFSGKVKSVLEARDEVATAYLELVKTFEKNRYFDFNFTPSSEGKNIQKVSQNLAAFEKNLNQWRDSLPSLVQEELSRLNAKNANEDLRLSDQIGELEYALDLLAEELNGVKLYEQPFENKMLTLPKRQKYLEEIIEQLESTRLYLRDYDHFYDWQRNWLLMADNATKVIRALIKVKPHNWLEAFTSWYLNNCLSTSSQAPLPIDDKAGADFVQSYNQFKTLLPSQINYYWQAQREEAFKKLKRDNREVFNLLFGKKNQDLIKDKTLQELLSKGMDTVTNVFPVLLTIPYAVTNDLPELTEHFDYVIFDEAQYLPYLHAVKSLQMAKKIVIVGDCSQLPANDEEMLLGWAKREEFPTVKLQTFHRQNPGNLLQVLNGKSAGEATAKQLEAHFEQLDGRYSETEGTNDEEAQRIIHLLNEVKPTDKRTFPTVGIACFTVAQRDLIASYLLKIKQKWSPGVEKIQQLERNGLGVFHLSELRGQHFDVMFVSSTFGIMDAKGNLTNHTEQLNIPAFACDIRLLMSRPLQEIFIVNSIPEVNLTNWLEMPEYPGVFLLANYFSYNQALSIANVEHQQAIIQRLKDWAEPDQLPREDLVFAEEVALTIQPYLGVERVQTNVEDAALYLPLRVRAVHGQQPDLALQPDGFFARTPYTDFVWESQQKDLLRQQHFDYQSIWSLNWWRNARQEARKLAGSIIKTDSDYVTDL